ncbi:MAG: hypothetical protein J0H98_09735 [Solirubrobacterales bacterium]|nr:hypothetical protein [Solirubrobacterales bacterium]
MQKEKKSSRVAARAADAIDLIIEFATLGEYGLEYPEPAEQPRRKNNILDIQSHEGRSGSTPQRHRHGRRPCRPGRTRVDLPGWGDRPGNEVPGTQPGRRHRAEKHRAQARVEAQAGTQGLESYRTAETRRNQVRQSTESRRRERNRPSSALPDVLRPPRIQLEAA